MKVVLGVDFGGTYARALSLVRAMGLPQAQYVLANVVEPVMPDMGFPELSDASPIAQIMRLNEEEGRQKLAEVAADLQKAGFACESRLLFGSAAGELVALTEAEQADLVAVGSERKGKFGSLFMGSVAKGLALSSKSSLLVGKSEPSGSKLRVVFATDQSDYANQCVDRLVEFAPEGIEELTVVTAVESVLRIVPTGLSPDVAGSPEEDKARMQRFEMGAASIAERLKAVCGNVQVRVERGTANESINSAMKSSNADLLIMGAQGAGFLQRVFIGSVSLHQVVAEPHNVLLLRA